MSAVASAAPIPGSEIHECMPEWIAEFLAERGYTWEQMERGELWGRRDEPGPLGPAITCLEDLQETVMAWDPVKFVECTLVRRDLPGQPPWRLWDYQASSMRYRGNGVWECGSEVGKSQEITGLCIWRLLTCKGDQLVAGAADVHSTAIWNDVKWQLQNNPYLSAQIDWEETKKKPYVELVAKNGNRVFFRPAGVDGTSLRSAHCRGAIYMDEAVKCRNNEIWSNFFSRAMPGAEIRIYSTPDGNRSTRFFELCQSTPAVDPHRVHLHSGAGVEVEGLEGRSFIRVRWPKELMPSGFYDAARLAEWRELYGSESSPEYQHNVHGNWGDPENSIFPWSRLRPCLRYVEPYRAVELILDDDKGTVYASAHDLNPGYTVTGPTGDEDETARATAPLRQLTYRDEVPRHAFSTVDGAEQVLRRWLAPLPGHFVVGIDPGAEGDDPTEILYFQVLGRTMTCVARVRLNRFPAPLLRQVVYAARNILQPSHGWGLDATGGGTYLQQELESGEDAYELADNLSGIVSNAKLPDVHPETGEPEVDPNTGEPRKVTYKELGVRFLERDVDQLRIILPFDPIFALEWQDFTARISSSSGQRTFGHNKRDHTVAATITARLRLHLLEHGDGVLPPVTFASVSRRSSGAGSRAGDRRRPRAGSRPFSGTTSAGAAAALSDFAGGGHRGSGGDFHRPHRRGSARRGGGAARGLEGF